MTTITVEFTLAFIGTPEGVIAAATARRIIALERVNRQQALNDLEMHRRELKDVRAIELFDRVIGLMAATLV